nr:glycosyltransferase family 2 protein [Lachnospiraceae bacterium]
MKTFHRKSISAIIVSYNDREIMRRCLAALSAQLDVKGDEIIVVDNGSTDGVLEDLRADSREKLIENGENAGFPAGCNIGFEATAPGNDIFLINNDAVLSEGALDNLCEALYAAEDIGAVVAVSDNAREHTVEKRAGD